MARPIWTGSISFGLVSIGVEMSTVVRDRSIHFHMLNKEGTCRLRRKLVCPDSGKEYDFGQTSRGIEVGPGEYVLIDQKEIAKIKPEKGRSLEIVQFAAVEEIDPIHYENVYYLRPSKDARKPYKLLTDAMAQSGKIALGKFVMRDKEHLVVIRPVEETLVLHTLHYSDEVEAIDAELIDSMKKIKVSAPELKMAGELIKAMTTELDLAEFKDEFRAQLKVLVDAKVKGKNIKMPTDDQERVAEPKTINLMDALKKSLAAGPAKFNTATHHHRRSA